MKDKIKKKFDQIVIKVETYVNVPKSKMVYCALHSGSLSLKLLHPVNTIKLKYFLL